MTTAFHELDVVALRRDIPSAGLKTGDVGTVVRTYSPTSLEVEFVTASGLTQALLTLEAADVRPVTDNDLLAVRSLPSGRGAAP